MSASLRPFDSLASYRLSLPSLERAAKDAGCGPGSSDQDVLALLRRTAAIAQNGTPVRFYSIRRVSAQFERPASTVGLVIECKREDPNMLDGLIWYCENCNNKLHEYRFHLDNIEKDFLPRFREFYASKELRTCKKCGTVMETDPRFV